MTDFSPVKKLSFDALSFADQLAKMYNHGAIVSMISIGHQLGIFDQMALMKPASSDDIAKAVNLDERYLREWLAVLTTGQVIEYDSINKLYYLPPQYALCLTRASSPENLAVTSQFVTLIAQTEPHLLKCFQTGEGLQYCQYPEFHKVMSEDSHQTVVEGLFDHILPILPGIEDQLKQGIKVMDAGCGAGLALLKLAKSFPQSQFMGYDLCADSFAVTKEIAKQQNVSNLNFESCDLTHLSEKSEYDLVTTFDAVHDQASPASLLSNIHKSLKPGGMYLMQDIAGSSHLEKNMDHPMAPLLYGISCAHCTPVSLGQGGPGLGTMWGVEMAEQMLADAGFKEIISHELDHDPFNVYFVSRV